MSKKAKPTPLAPIPDNLPPLVPLTPEQELSEALEKLSEEIARETKNDLAQRRDGRSGQRR